MKVIAAAAVAALVALGAMPAQATTPAWGKKCTADEWGAQVDDLMCVAIAKRTFVWAAVPLTRPPRATTTTGPAPTAPPAPAAGTIKEGQWLVPSEVAPGTYRTATPDCYYERLIGFSGKIEDTVDNGFTSANGGIITIATTDKAFKSRCSWVRIG